MPRRKQPRALFSVFVDSYVDNETRERIERGEAHLTQPAQIRTELIYQGPSERQAAWAFYQAVRDAGPLVFSIETVRGLEPIASVRIEHKRL